MYLPLSARGNKDRRGAAPCAAPVPLILKRSKGTERVAKFRGSSVCGSRWCHKQVVVQKQLVAAKRKGNGAVHSDQCCRPRVFNKHGRRMRRCDIPLGLLGDRHAESLGIRTASGRVSKVSGSNENTGTKKAPGGHG